MADDMPVCEARSPSTGEPVCSREATLWHVDGEDFIAICVKHACRHCVPMDRPETTTEDV